MSKNGRRILYLLLCFWVPLMCHSPLTRESLSSTQVNDRLIRINLDDLDIRNYPVQYSNIFKSYKLIPLETNEHCMIGRIDELEVVNDTIYVFDRDIAKSLYVFDMNGQYIRKIGKLGQGPGEYIQAKSFTVDESRKEIQILDRGKILIFSLTGNLIRELALRLSGISPGYIKSLHGTTYIDHRSYPGAQSTYLLSAWDSSGNMINKWLLAEHYTKGFQLLLSTGNHFCRSPYDIKFMRTFMDTIFSIKDNVVRPYMVFNTNNQITSEEMTTMNSIKDPMESLKHFWRCKKFVGIQNYVESRNLIMFQFQNQGFTHLTLYYPGHDELICSDEFLFDDLVTKTDIYVRFYSGYKDYFVSVIDHNFGLQGELIGNVKKGVLKLTEKERLSLEKLTMESNPVIVFYECRDKFSDNPEIDEK